MYVNQYTVAVKTLGGTTVTFADSTDAGAGAAAYDSVLKGKDIHANVTSGETTTEYVIPFNAIDSATVTLSRTTAEDPVDSTCTTT